TFPQKPPTEKDEHRIITGMCDQLAPDKFAEEGCMVCSELVPLSDLTLCSGVDLDLSLLVQPGVTRKERHSVAESVTEIEGPVLADDCNKICVKCKESIQKHICPLRSLANYLWVGKVPWQLNDLLFTDVLLIAKVRHSHCVIHVASGRGKLSVNAIMFTNPTHFAT
ncbi:hypothetical protein B0H10DRAFT_1806640, partial [Mycena sp. CBHHK59/15]